LRLFDDVAEYLRLLHCRDCQRFGSRSDDRRFVAFFTAAGIARRFV
jgi:hypothetical protein